MGITKELPMSTKLQAMDNATAAKKVATFLQKVTKRVGLQFFAI